METVHYNSKEIRFDLDGKIIDFPSRKKLLKYMEDAHGLGNTTVRLIIKRQEPYKPRQHALKYLTGLRIYYIGGKQHENSTK